MAIVKMKKLRLMAIRSNKDALLKELIVKELLKRESSSLMTFKSQHMALVNAVGILDRYSPAKKPLLSALPEVGEDVLLDDSGVGAALAAADEISANEDRIKSIGAEVGRLENTIDALKPWASLDMPLGTTETQRCSVVLGTVAGSTDFSAMESALAAVTEEAELFLVDADKMQKYLVLVCMKEQHAAVMDCMRGFSFAAAPVSGMNGTARECIAAAEKELHKLADEKAGCAQHIVELAEHRDELKLAADVLGTKIARAEAEAKAARERAARAERNRLAREKAAASGKKVPETKPEADPVREERVADTKGGYAMTKAEKRLSDDFASNKGRLPYPVSGRHTIVAAFGEQQHQELKYVRTNNSGIDIQTAPGTDARAVFNGEVTRVFVVPGYNNSVIVRHGNYLTVYSNLSQVYVKAGDKVSTRQAIGKIFTDTEDGNATILHFQLWKEKTKLNPAPWLD